MRSTAIVLAVLATLASTMAATDIGVDCASLAPADRAGKPECDIAASPSGPCDDDETVTGEAWLNVFKTCVGASTSEDSLCECYKTFLAEGFKSGCQTAENLQYVAAQGVRYGLGEPFYTGATNGTCDNPLIDGGIYSGPGTIFTAAVGDNCLPACSQICSSEICSDASVSGPAALMATVVAAAAYLLN